MTAWQKGGMARRRQHLVIQLSESGRSGAGHQPGGNRGHHRCHVRCSHAAAPVRVRSHESAAWQKGGMAEWRHGKGAWALRVWVLGGFRSEQRVGRRSPHHHHCRGVQRRGRCQNPAWQKLGMAKSRPGRKACCMNFPARCGGRKSADVPWIEVNRSLRRRRCRRRRRPMRHSR